jgi:hypothetical protein
MIEKKLHVPEDADLAIGRYENPVNKIGAREMQHFPGDPLALMPEQRPGIRTQLLLDFM